MHLKNFNKYRYSIFFGAMLLTVAVLPSLVFFRIDLTSEKRYSLSEPSKKLMKNINGPLKITVYLDGELNSGFLRLKRATSEMLDELSVYAPQSIQVQFSDPSSATNSNDRNANYARMSSLGMSPTVVYDRDKDGKTMQKLVFPWVEIHFGNRTETVNLLKNIPGNSGDENLNISIENLEFELTDGIRRATNTTVNKIAFLEGHGELSDAATNDVSRALSRYFQIDRGNPGTNAAGLDGYKAVIIAKPTRPFSEAQKFIIDQYIMHGGRVLWLIDGVKVPETGLSVTGKLPAIDCDVNLNDQLFCYGVRINPVLLQDVQCVTVPVNIAPAGSEPQFESSSFYYMPLLLTAPDHPVTRNIAPVLAPFCSGIDLVGDNRQVTPRLMLATSGETHITGVPAMINPGEHHNPKDKNYFNAAYIPVAVSLEGNFRSDFENRSIPDGLRNTSAIQTQSFYTRQIVVSCGDIIRNDTTASDSIMLQCGFDRLTNRLYGNRDFIVNALLYLTDDAGWMQLRSRTFKLRLLSKEAIAGNRATIQIVNVGLPLIFLLIFGTIYIILRKRRYTRQN